MGDFTLLPIINDKTFFEIVFFKSLNTDVTWFITSINKIARQTQILCKNYFRIQFAHIGLTAPTSGLHIKQIVLKNIIYL